MPPSCDKFRPLREQDFPIPSMTTLTVPDGAVARKSPGFATRTRHVGCAAVCPQEHPFAHEEMTTAPAVFPHGRRQSDCAITTNVVGPHRVVATHKIDVDVFPTTARALEDATPNYPVGIAPQIHNPRLRLGRELRHKFRVETRAGLAASPAK
jgi:hypothetical protein